MNDYFGELLDVLVEGAGRDYDDHGKRLSFVG